jgi:hypothetical protein
MNLRANNYEVIVLKKLISVIAIACLLSFGFAPVNSTSASASEIVTLQKDPGGGGYKPTGVTTYVNDPGGGGY